MSFIIVTRDTPTWLIFVASDVDTGDPRTGIIYSQINCYYKKANQAGFQSKTLSGSNFRECGYGVYEIQFSASDLSTDGSFVYMVESNLSLPNPPLRRFVSQTYVQDIATITPDVIILPIEVIYGNLITLRGDPISGASVSARIVSSPYIIGTSPDIGGIGTDLLATTTNELGFFSLELIQGSVVDIVIPAIKYRRTLTVPSNGSDRLFDIP